MFQPFSLLIRLQRDQLGLSLDALSALSGVSRSRIAALEKGDDNVTLDVLVKLANALRMKEVRIAGLRVEGATPDFKALAAAADAMMVTRKIIEQAAAASAELERVWAPVLEHLAPVISPARPAEQPIVAPGLVTLAKAMARRRRKQRRSA